MSEPSELEQKRAERATTPPTITLDRVDVLELALLRERRRSLDLEYNHLIERLSHKHGVDLNGYSVNPETGHATRKG